MNQPVTSPRDDVDLGYALYALCRECIYISDRIRSQKHAVLTYVISVFQKHCKPCMANAYCIRVFHSVAYCACATSLILGQSAVVLKSPRKFCHRKNDVSHIIECAILSCDYFGQRLRCVIGQNSSSISELHSIEVCAVHLEIVFLYGKSL